MKLRNLMLVLIVSLVFFVGVAPVQADTLTFKNGTKVDGIIMKVEAGRVFVDVGNGTKMFNTGDVQTMDFNTPHVPADISKVTLEHFLKDPESQEIVRNLQQLDKTAKEIQLLLAQIQIYWAARQPIDAKAEGSWAVAKETFRQPLMAYQEILNDLQILVLARVDEYNRLMKEASRVYVGTKGVRIGSALIPSEMENLPLKKYVPATWYDTIFYDGYNLGFADGTQKASPRSYN